jgi:hypothetical protein
LFEGLSSSDWNMHLSCGNVMGMKSAQDPD